MLKKIVVAAFVAVVGVAVPVLAADCCVPGGGCCDTPCCQN